MSIPSIVKLGLEVGKLYVYDGDVVGWIECEIEQENKGIKMLKHNIVSRVTVKTNDGTLLTRFLKEVKDIKDVLQDGSVYKLIK